MKKIVQIIILILVTINSFGNQWHLDNFKGFQNLSDTTDITEFNKVLSGWISHYNKYSIELTQFKFINEDYLPDISAKLDKIDLSKDIYEPFYKYSPDKSLILDLTSYNILLEKNKKNEIIYSGAGPDNEVSIKDLKNNEWK